MRFVGPRSQSAGGFSRSTARRQLTVDGGRLQSNRCHALRCQLHTVHIITRLSHKVPVSTGAYKEGDCGGSNPSLPLYLQFLPNCVCYALCSILYNRRRPTHVTFNHFILPQILIETKSVRGRVLLLPVFLYLPVIVETGKDINFDALKI